MQVTLRVAAALPSLRSDAAWAVIVRVLRKVREAGALRIVHYSVLSNHLHLIVEADSHAAFVRGMRMLTIRLALQLNRLFARKGRVFEHRYHSRPLASPREVWLSLQYVLLNERKHAAERGLELAADWIDPRSSGRAFDGWQACSGPQHAGDFGTSAPRTWLLAHGWRRCGLIRIDAVPGRDNAVKRAA